MTSVPAQRVAAVGALGRMLHTVQRDAQRLEEMQRGFLDGNHVVDLDPEVVDPSPIRDRIDDETSDEQARLNASIAESGQRIRSSCDPAQTHPIASSWCSATGALLQLLQTAARFARLSLTFRKRTLWWRRGRKTTSAKTRPSSSDAYSPGAYGILTNLQIASALAVHPSLSSVMMGIAEGIPEDLILAIGPAPNIGRPRWQALILSLQSGSSGDGWRNVASEPGFAALPSTTRFQRILDGLSIKAPALPSLVSLRTSMALSRQSGGLEREN